MVWYPHNFEESDLSVPLHLRSLAKYFAISFVGAMKNSVQLQIVKTGILEKTLVIFFGKVIAYHYRWEGGSQSFGTSE